MCEHRLYPEEKMQDHRVRVFAGFCLNLHSLQKQNNNVRFFDMAYEYYNVKIVCNKMLDKMLLELFTQM